MPRNSQRSITSRLTLLTLLLLMAIAVGSSFIPALRTAVGAQDSAPQAPGAQPDPQAQQGIEAQQDANALVLQDLSPKLSAQAQENLNRALTAYQALELNTKQIKQQVDATGRFKLKLGDAEYDLKLEMNNLRAPQLRWVATTEKGEVEVPLSPVSTYKGQVARRKGSVVRVSIREDEFSGYIKIGSDWL